MFLLLIFPLLPSTTHGARPQRFHQEAELEPISGLFGTEIGDIVWSGRYLWVATQSGLARLDPSRASGASAADWVTFTELNGLGRGSISALDAVGDTIWAATLVDTVVAGQGTFQMGTGLSYSTDAGRTWNHLPNQAIFDTSKAGFRRGPTTPILNACFDLAMDGSWVYAAFLAGSLVRSPDQGRTWERVLPGGAGEIVYFARDTAADSLAILADSLSQAGGDALLVARLRAEADSLKSQEFLHRTFAVLAYGDTLWVGTSSGIAQSFDGGRTWRNSKVRTDPEGQPLPGNPAGNWVVALERQALEDGAQVIWAGTNVTGQPGEQPAISLSRDLGQNWAITGPTFAWNFAFTPNFVWAATDQGLLASEQAAGHEERQWEKVEVSDLEPLRGTFVGLETAQGVLWAGAENGLGRSADEGRTWKIIRDLVRTRALDSGAFVAIGGVPDSTALTYAAPNPFAPSQEPTLIVFGLQREAQVTIEIYDFASRRVRTLVEDLPFSCTQDHQVVWDGRDQKGQRVANGVYFYRIELDSGQRAFGKVVVLD
jgi:hypothetical protein